VVGVVIDLLVSPTCPLCHRYLFASTDFNRWAHSLTPLLPALHYLTLHPCLLLTVWQLRDGQHCGACATAGQRQAGGVHATRAGDRGKEGGARQTRTRHRGMKMIAWQTQKHNSKSWAGAWGG
jgi:hypothetical protein